MAADLAHTPTSGLQVQACGDAHLANFGAFSAPDRRLVFDLNDFDETLPGPWEWDVKRLAASFEIAARENGFKGKERRTVLATVAREYREAMRGFAKRRNLEVWYARLDAETVLGRSRAEGRKTVRRSKRASPRRTGEGFDVEATIRGVIESYGETLKSDRRRLLESYRFRHIARKVVGVGSVGTRAWIVLLTGRDDSDPLILQAREAHPPCSSPTPRRATSTTKGGASSRGSG